MMKFYLSYESQLLFHGGVLCEMVFNIINLTSFYSVTVFGLLKTGSKIVCGRLVLHTLTMI